MKIIIDPTVTNLLGRNIDESVLKECEDRPEKTGFIIKSHLYDSLPVNDVPTVTTEHTADGLLVSTK